MDAIVINMKLVLLPMKSSGSHPLWGFLGLKIPFGGGLFLKFVQNDIIYVYIVVFMVLNLNLPFLTPETSFFTCFGVDTASPLAQEWLGSKVGLVKKIENFFPQIFNC